MRYAAVAVLALTLAACAAGPPPPPPGRVPFAATTGLNAHIPPFARGPYEPFSREAAIQIALGEWWAFRKPVKFPNIELPEDEEREEGFWQRVGLYWWLGLDPSWAQSGWTGIHDQNGQVFPAGRDGYFAWSAAFISYVMRLAGAGGSFPYSENHADYINAAAQHTPGVALEVERVEVYAPQRGDLICLWRGRRVTFDQLPAGRFPGHCDIVIDRKAGQLDVIGGNVDNAVAMKYIPVTADGHLAAAAAADHRLGQPGLAMERHPVKCAHGSHDLAIAAEQRVADFNHSQIGPSLGPQSDDLEHRVLSRHDGVALRQEEDRSRGRA